jgi:hypothetical protein
MPLNRGHKPHYLSSRSEHLSLPPARTHNSEHKFAQYTTTSVAQRPGYLGSPKNTNPEKGESGPHRPESPVSSETSDEEFGLLFESRDNLQILNFSSITKADTTINFVLDVVDDIESQLEEMGRLKRWGHFKEALEYFKLNLECHLDLPWVTIEYADLLLEQGAYQKLVQLRLKAPTKPKFIPVTGARQPDLYGTHFQLIEKCARLSFESLTVHGLGYHEIEECASYFHRRTHEQRYSHHKVGLETAFDSTEVKMKSEI